MAGRRNPVSKVCAAALVVVLGGLLACCFRSPTPNPTGAAVALTRFYSQTPAWWSCEQLFECTSLTVPLDYAKPAGTTIQLAVIRARATDPEHRIGSLITNPGGPGGSGVTVLKHSYPDWPGHPSHFGPQLRARFDIVGFDPRGVGRSVPITCLTDTQLDHYTALDPAPGTPAEVDAVVAAVKAFDAGCQTHSAPLLPHVGTPNTARDLDILRAVLGDPKLFYLGSSYGTYLGAVYAELFPSHLARVVLDGAVPPTLTAGQMAQGHAGGAQEALAGFIADCVSHPDCPLGRDAATAAAKLADLFAATRAHPLPIGTGRALGQASAETGVLVALYGSPQSWRLLRQALAGAMAGDGHGLLALADQYYGRDPLSGRYPTNLAAGLAISCLDRPGVRSAREVQAELAGIARSSPLLGTLIAWRELPCAYWPVRPQSRPHPIRYAGSPPILVVGTTHDLATRYSWAQDLAGQLGSAVLLTYQGSGHLAYGRGSGCLDTAVDTYLVQGAVPATGTVCQPDA
ncbi:MAG TPA: alpha/beta hydrolase [Pseudonocardiaceae bacterium]|jgi:pimeloyl-ACP methyl ester carboxylesterase